MRSVVQVHLSPFIIQNKLVFGGVAQLGEHLPCKQGVKSSNLSVSISGDKPDSVYLENFIQKENWSEAP